MGTMETEHRRLKKEEDIKFYKLKEKEALKELRYYIKKAMELELEIKAMEDDRIEEFMKAPQPPSKLTLIKENIPKEGIKTKHLLGICKKKGLTEDEFEDAIEKLKRTGNIFEPLPNMLRVI
mgnify:CR=1 FL=1|jgi:DNA replicative helicase MCM subunit Mcm2 (Cdc46/Mcm family)|tara:strand:- start:955 stop:1320 length:366 start_codon:yes stop_codon:yes gene_type:complete